MELLKFLQEIRNPLLDVINILLTNLGQETVLVVIMCLLYWCMNKKFAYKIGFAYFVSGMLVQTLKVICKIPRPWHLDSSLKPVDAAVEKATGYSFPSGHTQAATALYSSIALEIKKRAVQILMFALILGVAFSRMYLGVHSPLDVTASMFVTLLTVVLVNYIIDSKLIYKFSREQVVAGLLIIPLAVLVFGTIQVVTGSIDLANVRDLFKSAGAGIGFTIGWYLEGNVLIFDETAGTTKDKAIRLVAGLVILIGLKTGLKYVFGSNLVACVLVYGFIMFWAVFLYPLLFTKISKKS